MLLENNVFLKMLPSRKLCHMLVITKDQAPYGGI